MGIIEIVFGIIIVLAAIIVTIAVLAQPAKKSGLSGAIAGGSSDSYYGKGKAQTREKKLNTAIILLAVFFAVVVLVFYIWQPFKARADYGNPDDYYGIPEQTTTAADSSTSTPSTTSAPASTSTPASTSAATPITTQTPNTTDAWGSLEPITPNE